MAESRALPLAEPTSRLEALRGWLVESWTGRPLLDGDGIKLLTLTTRPLTAPSGMWGVVDTLADLAILLGALAILFGVWGVLRCRLLWRVRRKRTLSYIFIGVVLTLLIITFSLLAGLLAFFSLSSYLTQTRIGTRVEQVELLARVTAEALWLTDAADEVTLVIGQAAAAARYPGVSYAWARTLWRFRLQDRHPDVRPARRPGRVVQLDDQAFVGTEPPYADIRLLVLKITGESAA